MCDDISEFESHMPSHAVQSLCAVSGLVKTSGAVESAERSGDAKTHACDSCKTSCWFSTAHPNHCCSDLVVPDNITLLYLPCRIRGRHDQIHAGAIVGRDRAIQIDVFADELGGDPGPCADRRPARTDAIHAAKTRFINEHDAQAPPAPAGGLRPNAARQRRRSASTASDGMRAISASTAAGSLQRWRMATHSVGWRKLCR
jgi:hypothetical protein